MTKQIDILNRLTYINTKLRVRQSVVIGAGGIQRMCDVDPNRLYIAFALINPGATVQIFQTGSASNTGFTLPSSGIMWREFNVDDHLILPQLSWSGAIPFGTPVSLWEIIFTG